MFPWQIALEADIGIINGKGTKDTGSGPGVFTYRTVLGQLNVFTDNFSQKQVFFLFSLVFQVSVLW